MVDDINNLNSNRNDRNNSGIKGQNNISGKGANKSRLMSQFK